MFANKRTPYHTLDILKSSNNPLSSFYMCEPTTFYSVCVLQIVGSIDRKKSIAFYKLDNGEVTYTCPVSAQVVDMSISTDSSIFLNESNVDVKDIKTLTKGDKLSFSFTSTKASKLYVEILLLCPLVKNE